MVYVISLISITAGVIAASVLEYRRIKREQKKMRKEFKIDTSEWKL